MLVNNTDKSTTKPKWLSFLGIRVQALTVDDIIAAIRHSIAENVTAVIANHNLHSLCLFHKQPAMRQFHALADYAHVDGMSVVLLARAFGLRLGRDHRTGYMDLLPELAAAASAEHWKIFYLGSKPGVARRAALLLQKEYPGLQLETHHGYFDVTPGSIENEAVLQSIREYAPDVLLVGMGMPRQEEWVTANRDRLDAHAILCSGALMDYVAGEIPTPPRWLGRMGLEWLYRLVSEPERLFHRYVIEPWSLLKVVGKELVSRRLRVNYEPGE
jgi:N-acetylglucosaminyldiphosphoundecaprenol N-acetyl-beta-D-mannosaminyltransferase